MTGGSVGRSFLGWLLAIAVAAGGISSTSAGPFEDANSAYERGDYATALRLWGTLAEQGNADAQFNLGVMYHEGQGVPQNHAEAAKWYRLAAAQGNAIAQNDKGLGIPQNYVLAHMWFNLAASQDSFGAVKNRDIVARKMTPQQIAEAQKLAAEWKPKTWDQLKGRVPK